MGKKCVKSRLELLLLASYETLITEGNKVPTALVLISLMVLIFQDAKCSQDENIFIWVTANNDYYL